MEIEKCPVCDSPDITQEWSHHQFSMNDLVGGSYPPAKDGSHCQRCGVRFAFNRKEGQDSDAK